jgi:hypothetical protein
MDLNLGVVGVESLERTAAHQGITLQHRPEDDLGLAQPVEVEGVLALQPG